MLTERGRTIVKELINYILLGFSKGNLFLDTIFSLSI